MNRRELLRLGASLLATTASGPARAQPWHKQFEKFVREGLARTHTPGLSVAVVRAGQPVLLKGYGLANVAAKVPVTPDTVFHLASVSKLVTGSALMLLLEQGAYQLDDPVNKYLDFAVVHPQFPEVPITFRHLLTHTSGISDATYGKTAAFATVGDATLPLREFLTGYLVPGGPWYAADGSFSAARPGAEWSYCNVAIALLGYLAGRVGPTALAALTQQQFFQPLGMQHTAWKIAEVPPARLAHPYSFADGQLHELSPVGYPDWPAGSLRASARDFSRFLAIFTNQGVVAGRRYLRPATLQTFLTPQSAAVMLNGVSMRQALIWRLRELGGRQVASHSGSDPGASALVCLDFQKQVGALVFTNASATQPLRDFQQEILEQLLTQADALASR